MFLTLQSPLASYHESPHSLLLNAFLFLLLLTLGVGVPHHHRLVTLADLDRHATVELFEVLRMLQYHIEILLQTNDPRTLTQFSSIKLVCPQANVKPSEQVLLKSEDDDRQSPTQRQVDSTLTSGAVEFGIYRHFFNELLASGNMFKCYISRDGIHRTAMTSNRQIRYHEEKIML